MDLEKVSVKSLARAVRIRRKLESLEAKFEACFNGRASRSKGKKGKVKKHFSAEGRRAIKAAQKRRWAAFRKDQRNGKKASKRNALGRFAQSSR